MGKLRQVPGDWVGQRVKVFLEGERHPRAGTLTKVKEEGVELAEEVYPDPYGEGAAQEGSPTFFGYDSIAKVHPAED